MPARRVASQIRFVILAAFLAVACTSPHGTCVPSIAKPLNPQARHLVSSTLGLRTGNCVCEHPAPGGGGLPEQCAHRQGGAARDGPDIQRPPASSRFLRRMRIITRRPITTPPMPHMQRLTRDEVALHHHGGRLADRSGCGRPVARWVPVPNGCRSALSKPVGRAENSKKMPLRIKNQKNAN